MKNWRSKLPWFSLVILALVISVIAIVSPACSLYNWFNTDDGYYYFTVARNIAAGNGSTFDGINLTNGYHPLWMLVCVAVFFLFGGGDPILPLRVIALLGGLLNVASTLLLYRILTRVLHKSLAWAAAAVWASLPAIQLVTTAQGLETGLAVGLLFLLVDRAQVWFGDNAKQPSTRHLLSFGFLAALTVLARLDNLFYIILLCVFAILQIRFRRGVFLYDWIAVSFSAYFAWVVLLLLNRSEVQNHAVFPLLLLSLCIRPLILWFCNQYQPPVPLMGRERRLALFRTIASVLLSSLTMVAVLYAINALHIFIRFAKLLILIEGASATLLLGLNHLLPHFSSLRVRSRVPGQSSSHLQPGWRKRLLRSSRDAALVGAPGVIFLGGYLLYNRFHFQSWMPISGMMKHFWSTLSNSVYGRPRFFFDVFAWGGRVNPWDGVTDTIRAWASRLTSLVNQSWLTREASFCLLLALGLAAVFLLLRFGRIAAMSKLNTLFFPALFLGSLARAGYYALTGYVALRTWYWVLERALLLILAALLLEILVTRLVRRSWGSRLLSAGAGLLFVVLLAGALRFGLHFTPLVLTPDQQEVCFQSVHDLEAATEPGALIGMTGSGCKGYYVQGRTIVNLDGLISSRAYYDSVVDGTAAEFLADMGLNYMYGSPEILLQSGPYDSLFAGHLQQLQVFTNSEALTLYRFTH